MSAESTDEIPSGQFAMPYHSGNLILKKGFLLYFLPECSSFTKKINIKRFFVITKVPFFSKFSS